VYLKELVKRFDAEPSKRIDTLSKGNRQKIGIIQALMHKPDVLILDEPTSGLDPLMQEVFYDCIREASQRGAAVFFSSHNLNEVQSVCDRVGIIREGKLIKEQRVSELAAGGMQRFTITFDGAVPAEISKQPSIKVLSQQNGVAVVETDKLPLLFSFLAKHKIVKFVSTQTSLEEEFLQFYGDES
jgi:ABC-2 type transport system ATP-binding protein